jgi:MinD-like ATPase involved in chromosome partitioning or flagellar assembly
VATISLLSAKGSPGVTTATVALTMAWSTANPGRRALAVDADPIGGDTAAGVLRGAVPTRAGILALATARGIDLQEALDAACVHLRADGSARLLPGIPDQARAGAIPLAWDVLADLRADLHHQRADVLVDAGRVDRALGSAWLADSDLAVLVVRPTLAAVMAAHRFVEAWPFAGVPLHLLVVTAESPYGVAEVGEAVGTPLLGAVAFDPASARVHSEGAHPGRGFERSDYARSVRRVARDLGALAIARADLLLPALQSDEAIAPLPAEAVRG